MENNTILAEKTAVKTPITINITVEARSLYEKLKKEDFKLSDKVDELIKKEAKKRGIK